MKTKNNSIVLFMYLICYGVSFVLARNEFYLLSGFILIISAIALYAKDYWTTKNLLHLRALFSLSWVGGQGIACFKLSHLQGNWSLMTWFCFLAAFMGFWITFEIFSMRDSEEPKFVNRSVNFSQIQERLFFCINLVTIVSLGAFLLEAIVLGFIPLFLKGVPHAYSTFHISGVHYFTVSCVLVPSLSVIYIWFCKKNSPWRLFGLAVLNFIAIAIPILCVSRFQLIFALILAAFTFIAMNGKLKLYYAMGLLALLVPLYVMLTVARSHDVTYLNGIFEMKDTTMPIFISQPYIYIANNYDNFNCLVEELPKFTFGLRMLFPLWALTGLKFVFPNLVAFEIFTTKNELSTVSLFYDAYYDFGVLGVLFFSCILGCVSYFIVKSLKRIRNPISYLFYGQIAIYLCLSFFTTWFSNPTTWFWLAMTGLVYWIVGKA